MFHIKICGVRHPSDIEAVSAAGADAIGLNFFANSIRFADPLDARTAGLSQTAEQENLLRVGVFVNATIPSIRQIAKTVGLDAVQLHGDEPVSFGIDLLHAVQKPVIRAIKLPTVGLDAGLLEAAINPWIEIGCHPLLDADAGSAHGGSGKNLDWQAIGIWATQHPAASFTLAGGLNPKNVGLAIKLSRATSVDTASGVEQPRGQKHAELIRGFVQACGKSGLSATDDQDVGN